MMGRDITDTFPPGLHSIDADRVIIEAVAEDGSAARCVVHITLRDGTEIHYNQREPVTGSFDFGAYFLIHVPPEPPLWPPQVRRRQWWRRLIPRSGGNADSAEPAGP